MWTPRSSVIVLITLAIVTAALRLAEPVLMPLALALLVSFWLGPIVARIERTGLGRLASVSLAVTLVVVTLGGLGWLFAGQVTELSARVPEYRRNLSAKIRTLKGPIGAVGRAVGVVDELEREIESQQPAQRAAPKVEVVEPTSPLETAAGLVAPLLEPLGIAAAVSILVIFMLLRREDLRDRLIRLAGSGDVTRTTHAIDDASSRLGRFLGMQSLLCAIHGVLVGVGLAVIGVPSALLWGILAGLLRFIPYAGPFVAAAIPIGISLVAFDVWTPVLLTLGWFILLELVVNNVLEPWLYGSSAGMSPFGVVLSAFFWTWLWGLPGLFLATPLTLCLVVIGKYVDELAFVHVLFGEEAALTREVRFYQRVLALDASESAEILRRSLEEDGLEATSDGLVLPTLGWLNREIERGAVSRERARRIHDMLAELIAELPRSEAGAEPEAGTTDVVLLAGRDDKAALGPLWLEHVLVQKGLRVGWRSRRAFAGWTGRPGTSGAFASPGDAIVPGRRVCLSVFSAEAALHARRAAREILAADASLRIVVGAWANAQEVASGPPSHIAWVHRTSELVDALHAGVPMSPGRSEVLTSCTG